MASIKVIGNKYYMMRKRWKGSVLWTSIFPVRAKGKEGGSVSITHLISTPKELVGKKIRFKVEVVEDERDRKRQG